MNRTVVALCSILILLSGCSEFQSSESGYEHKINLNEIEDDELLVELAFTGELADVSHFCLPKIVPGIYAALNYGRFIDDLEAFDKKGRSLKVHRTDSNCWKINDAKNVATVKYKVNDGWESFDFQGIRACKFLCVTDLGVVSDQEITNEAKEENEEQGRRATG